jgi:hypothetical protein
MTADDPAPTPAGLPRPGALARVPVTGGEDGAPLPAAPSGELVTVSLSPEAADALDSTGLTKQGYWVVGVAAEPPGGAVVDVCAADDTLRRNPEWWRAVAARAERVFNLAAGPVRLLLGSVLTAHATAALAPIQEDDGSASPSEPGYEPGDGDGR